MNDTSIGTIHQKYLLLSKKIMRQMVEGPMIDVCADAKEAYLQVDEVLQGTFGDIVGESDAAVLGSMLTRKAESGGMGMLLPGQHYEGLRAMAAEGDMKNVNYQKVRDHYGYEASRHQQLQVGPAMNSWEPLPDIGLQRILRQCFTPG